MSRVAVHRYDADNARAEVAGWFDPDLAEVVEEADPMTAQRFAGLRKRGGPARAVEERLYRTREGRWVHHVELHVGPNGEWVENGAEADPRLGERAERHRFLDDVEAREWLAAHARPADVDRFFPDVPAERGPGRPEIGQPVHVRLGRLLPLVDQWAAAEKCSRAEAVRRLVAKGLASGEESKA